MLAEWKLGGWPAMFGCTPEPDDLIVPLPPDAAARRRSRTGDAYRGHDYAGKRWREEDLPALGWRYREPYATKATFITLAIEDGARPEIIRDRVTHAKIRRSAFDGYDRGPHWIETCGEVAKLQITRRAPAVEVVELATVRATAGAIFDGNLWWRRRESKDRLRQQGSAKIVSRRRWSAGMGRFSTIESDTEYHMACDTQPSTKGRDYRSAKLL